MAGSAAPNSDRLCSGRDLAAGRRRSGSGRPDGSARRLVPRERGGGRHPTAEQPPHLPYLRGRAIPTGSARLDDAADDQAHATGPRGLHPSGSDTLKGHLSVDLREIAATCFRCTRAECRLPPNPRMQPTGPTGPEFRPGAGSLEDEAERKLVRARWPAADARFVRPLALRKGAT